MLDYVCIFTKGGALLWTWSLMSGNALRGNPVDALIRNWLLEERSGESSFSYTPPNGAAYSLKWTLHNVRLHQTHTLPWPGTVYHLLIIAEQQRRILNNPSLMFSSVEE